MTIGSDNTIERGGLKLMLDAVLKNDMVELNLSEHLTLDRA